MRIRVGALVAGLVTAALVAGFPASAADTTIAAMSAGYSWNPKNVTIQVGDTVTWTTDGVLPHNVCVQKPGTTGTTCDEFRNGDPRTSWSSYTNSHTFTTPGTYNFYCETHKSFGMVGTITVGGASTGTGTGTSTTPQPYPYPTGTTTTPTQTETQTTPYDTVAPHFTSKPKRRASRKSLILEFGASEAGKLSATVFRRPAGKRSFSRVGSASLSVKKGHDVVTLPRRAAGRLRNGAYRVTLRLVDAAGNKSATKTLVFKLA
jgi:plastocyanin